MAKKGLEKFQQQRGENVLKTSRNRATRHNKTTNTGISKNTTRKEKIVYSLEIRQLYHSNQARKTNMIKGNK